MRRASTIALGLWGVALLAACSVPEPRGGIGRQCELNSECAAPLVCRLGYCRRECVTSVDCLAPTQCVYDESDRGVCQIPAELSCALQNDCPESLVCRFNRCVNDCSADQDCPPGQRCRDTACLDDVRGRCTRDSDCAGDTVCGLDGLCREECRTNRDCRDNDYCDGVTDRRCEERETQCADPDGDTLRACYQSCGVGLAECETGHVCVMSEGLCRPECAVDPTDPTPCGYLGPGWECGPDGLCIPDIPDPFADAGTMDGGGMDSGVVDTGTMDAGGDTGPVDGGPDTGADAGPDVGPDADAGPDTGLDAGPCRADRFWGPVPYLSEADLPTDFMPTPRSYALLENFESVPTLMPGFSPVSGTPSSMGGVVDSVDSDDGTIDGVCTGCEAWFGTAASGGIVFDFVATALPGRQLPTRVGLAWTDGGGNVTLEAFGACGSLGTVVGMGLGDGDFLGGTAEDRFFGVQWSGGISSIRINNDGAGGIEVDHLHFVRD